MTRMDRQKLDREGWASKIVTAGATLFIFLMLVRAQIEGFYSWSFSSVLKLFPRMLLAAYYDLLYVASMSFLFLLCLFPVKSNPRLQRLIGHTYIALAVFSLIAAFVNVKLVKVLGGPLTYQWLYYSDFMGSMDLQNDLWSKDSLGLFAAAILMSFALLSVSRLADSAVQNTPSNRVRLIGILGIVFFALYVPFATLWVATRYHDTPKLVNPVVSFFQSIMHSRQTPALFTMNTPLAFDDLPDLTAALKPLPIRKTAPRTEVRNVVIFVLESVPAEYIDAYGGGFSATPELNRYRHQSVLFRNIYAHAPSTNESLVSILLSIYPWISYKNLTREYPAIVFPSLSSELKSYGYRNAFFTSADIRFQRADTFLSYRQIDKIEDYRSLRCNGRIWGIGSSKRWPFGYNTDDECLVEPFMDWATKSPEAPFFAILWTNNTHYPYYLPEERDFGVKEPSFNRYLNALHNSDRVLGKLLRRLEDHQLLNSTLVVVVSDHGEAFGRHQQFIHASKIYEENVHVPLILIQPALFSGNEYETIGGLVDLAPTIMHILNHPAPVQWQGRSLFSPRKTNRTYFFAAYSNFLFGYREGDQKYIFNATFNNKRKRLNEAKETTNEIYDLREDPTEMTNLSERLPNAVSRAQQRLAAWVQYQNKFINSLLVEK